MFCIRGIRSTILYVTTFVQTQSKRQLKFWKRDAKARKEESVNNLIGWLHQEASICSRGNCDTGTEDRDGNPLRKGLKEVR